jgi:hypothetical protein
MAITKQLLGVRKHPPPPGFPPPLGNDPFSWDWSPTPAEPLCRAWRPPGEDTDLVASGPVKSQNRKGNLRVLISFNGNFNYTLNEMKAMPFLRLSRNV